MSYQPPVPISSAVQGAPNPYLPQAGAGMNLPVPPLDPNLAAMGQDPTGASGPMGAPEKKSRWRSLLDHIQQNPDLVSILLHFAAGAAAPPKPGQNTLSVLADAAAGTADYSQMLQSQREDAAYKKAQLANQTTEAQATAKNADTNAAAQQTNADQAAWKQKADKMRLDLDAGQYKSEAEKNHALSDYYEAEAKAAGIKDSEAGAKQQLANTMAKAAVATGMFSGPNAMDKANLWAIDSVLHTQGESQEQMLQSMIKSSVDNAQKSGATSAKDLKEAVDGANAVFQYMQKMNLTSSVPQPDKPAKQADDAKAAVTTRWTSDKAVAPYIKAGYTLGEYSAADKGYQILDPNGKPALDTTGKPAVYR